MSDPVITKTAVTYSQSRTINMGNYENVNIFASCTLESVVPGSEDFLYSKAEAFVEAKLEEQAGEIAKGSLNKVAKNRAEALAKEEKTEEAPKKEKKAEKTEKKKAKKEEPEEDVEVEEIDENDLTLDHVRQALRDYAKEHGKPAAKSVMETVAGVKKMGDIPEDKFGDVILACEEAPEDDEDLD